MSRTGVVVLLTTAMLALPPTGTASDIPPVVEQVRVELGKKSSDAGGCPLPVVSHWASGFGGTNFSSDYQTSLLEGGHHVMPTLPFPMPGEAGYVATGAALVQKLAEWRAPISLRDGQPESLLYAENFPKDAHGKWLNLPLDASPLCIGPDGKLEKRLSPFGAIQPWYEVGAYHTISGSFKQLEQWYPDPPFVVLLSNNEPNRLMPKYGIESDQRYVKKYGTGKSAEFQRGAVGEGYVERYAALLKGLRDGLSAGAWREHALLVGYDAFGPPHFGRWHGWTEYSLSTAQEISPWPRVWDGASVSYYTNNWDGSTDYRVWSPQVEAMNWVFMLEETRRVNPDFWFELSPWDGNWGTNKVYAKEKSKLSSYLQAGQTWSPERYAGFVQFGMWLLKPRVVREFRGSSVLLSDFQREFEALVGGVDRVWENPTLTRFWRQGRLVPNPTREHPYQTDIPVKWKSVSRWFLLNTSLDPKGEWGLNTEVPVFSIANVMGEAGGREWLLYAHAPLGPHTGVKIEIPGYGNVTVDVTPGGVFYLVKEQDRSVTRVTDGGS